MTGAVEECIGPLLVSLGCQSLRRRAQTEQSSSSKTVPVVRQQVPA
jgi:hypothetical protein